MHDGMLKIKISLIADTWMNDDRSLMYELDGDRCILTLQFEVTVLRNLRLKVLQAILQMQ